MFSLWDLFYVDPHLSDFLGDQGQAHVNCRGHLIILQTTFQKQYCTHSSDSSHCKLQHLLHCHAFFIHDRAAPSQCFALQCTTYISCQGMCETHALS